MSAMKPARFSFDGTASVPGFSDGTTWNGFACPLFTSEQIPAVTALLATLGYQLYWETDTRALVLHDSEARETVEIFGTAIDGATHWRLEDLTWNEDAAT